MNLGMKFLTTLLIIAVTVFWLPSEVRAQGNGLFDPYGGFQVFTFFCSCNIPPSTLKVVFGQKSGSICVPPIPGVTWFSFFSFTIGSQALGVMSFPVGCWEIVGTGCAPVFECQLGIRDGTSV